MRPVSEALSQNDRELREEGVRRGTSIEDRMRAEVTRFSSQQVHAAKVSTLA